MWQLLAPLREEERNAFLALARRRSFVGNEVVCHEGDPADSLHLVEGGHFSVHASLASGAAVTFRILSAGDCFGELALLRADHRRTATVTALEPSRTLCVAASAFEAVRNRNPAIERVLSVLLADRVDSLSRRLMEAMYESLESRVCRRLVELTRSYPAADGAVTIPLSQAQLADLVGASRPPVNQVLQRLADLDVVGLGRSRIDVLDVTALERRCSA